MSNLPVQNSNYQTGGLDTASTLIDQVDEIKAQHVNGANSAIVQIETILGSGPSLKGTSTDLATRLNQQMDPLGNLIPVGGIIPYGGSTEPSGWALCNGQALSRTIDADLFAVIGTTYGVGDNSTTFNTPNFCSRLLMGVGTGVGDGGSGTGLPTGTALTAIARGEWKGSETHTLSASELPVITPTFNDPGHTHPVDDANGNFGPSKPYVAGSDNTTGGPGSNGALHSSTTGITMNPFGSGQAHSNMPPVIGVNWLIRR